MLVGRIGVQKALVVGVGSSFQRGGESYSFAVTLPSAVRADWRQTIIVALVQY
jgi:hypothetical protein